MTATARRFERFEQAFALCFEEEISGETYFATLAAAEADPHHAAIFAKLARIEAETAAALRPLAVALGLAPPNEDAIRRKGRASAHERTAQSFSEFMSHIICDYPVYVDEFAQLHALSPPEARPLAQLLTEHEVAMIDMARIFMDGGADPHAPLDAYLARLRAVRQS